MEKITIKGRDIYIAESHNQVLEAWARGEKANVFTLDYHTDTKRAFQNYAYWRAQSEMKSGLYPNHEKRTEELIEQKITGYLEKRLTLSQINDNLKHDEHIDFAVSTHIINRAFVLARSRNESTTNPHVFLPHENNEYQEQRIIEYSPLCIPGCSKKIHDGTCRTLLADSSLEDSVLDDAIQQVLLLDRSFFGNYILDIDCDYFNTEKSLNPKKYDSFKKLVEGSVLITIAREPVCVKICRHEGSLLNSDAILKGLISLFERI